MRFLITGAVMNIFSTLKLSLSIIILSLSQIYPQAKVYLVLGSDTAIWNSMNVGKYNCTYDLDLFTAPVSNTAVVMSASFRNPMVDSYGNKIKFTWWMMAGNIFHYATNNNVPIPNIMTMYLMKKYFGEKVELWGDELSLHYHTFSWTDYDQDGKYWWNQAHTFMETKDDFDFTLAQFLLDENIFPVSFRSGWHYMDNDWQNYLDTILPYSLHNDWPNVRTTTVEPIDNIFDWSQASSEFVPFHPSPENYQLPGTSNGWNVRSEYMGQVTQQLVNNIFIKANQGTDQIACFWSHLPDQNFLNEIQQVNSIVQQAAANYPNVQFKYCTAIEAYQLWLQSTDTVKPAVQISEIINGNDVGFQISTNEQIFQPQPFVAIKDRYERYFIADCQAISQNTWQTISSYPLSDIAKVGAAVTDTVGNLSTAFLNYLPDNKFLDNNDQEYSEVYGNWSTSANSAWDIDSRIASLAPGDSAKAKWILETGYSGLHNIFVQYPEVSDQIDTVFFKIYKNGSITNLDTLIVTDKFSEWLYVTTVDLINGENTYVEVYAENNGQNTKYLCADVLKVSAYVREVELNVSTNFIDLGEVSEDDTVNFTLELNNTGVNNLFIENIYSANGAISVDTLLPLNISGMSQAKIPLTFIPQELGSVEDTILIASNDPVNPVYKIPVSVQVLKYFIVVDNDDPEVYSETGNWNTSVAQAYGISSRYAWIQTTPNGPTATFTFELTRNGFYDIYEILPTTVNSADNALYKIILNGVTVDSFYQNQNIGSGSWKHMGRYFLNAGVPVSIKIIDSGESSAGPVIRADAFKIAMYDETSSVVEESELVLPDKITLYQNYPNPFNPATFIQYVIDKKQFVSLRVYDILGNEVALLVNEEKPAGKHEAVFNINKASSGIYFYELKTGNYSETKKMIFLK